MDWTIYHDDVANWARSYDGPKFHAMITDCPYEYGFMGKSWDDTGISFDPETWAALLQHLLPGAFIMSFAGARTPHRIATAIEDGGFIIHPHIYMWIYGSGLMKSTRIDTQIDKRAGAEREVIGKTKATYGYQKSGLRWKKPHYMTKATTPLAKAWEGHRYSLQVLRPAAEPIIVAQKPYAEGSTLDSIVETGAGAVWIDGTRYGENNKWPTNFIVICTCDPMREDNEHDDDCPISRAGEEARYFQHIDFSYDTFEFVNSGIYYCSKASKQERNKGVDFYWRKDATKLSGYKIITRDEWAELPPAERSKGNIHNTVKPLGLTKWMSTLMLPPEIYKPRRILVPFAGVMSEAIGAMLAGWDHATAIEIEEEHCIVGEARIEWWHGAMNDMGQFDPREIIRIDKGKRYKQLSLMGDNGGD